MYFSKSLRILISQVSVLDKKVKSDTNNISSITQISEYQCTYTTMKHKLKSVKELTSGSR